MNKTQDTKANDLSVRLSVLSYTIAAIIQDLENRALAGADAALVPSLRALGKIRAELLRLSRDGEQ